jgi:hypothetical protein
MRELLVTFWGILSWRSCPRDLPSSNRLLRWVALSYFVTSWAQAALVYGPANAHWFALGDLVLTVAVTVVCLFPSRWPRVPQTLSALLGTGAVLSVPMIVLLWLRPEGATDGFAAVLTMVSLPLLIWSGLVMAKILSQAMDKPLLLGIWITLVYFALSYLLLDQLPQRVGG